MHIAHTRPLFRVEDWEYYQTVNRKFAEALLEEMEFEDSPVVLCRITIFACCRLDKRRPARRARRDLLAHSLANAEAFGICPGNRIAGRLAGRRFNRLHLQATATIFWKRSIGRSSPAIEREHFAVNRNGHSTLVRPFPISVADHLRSRPRARVAAH